jgi:ABC-type dipeptide/oligopeptide/nickel transport system permease component
MASFIARRAVYAVVLLLVASLVVYLAAPLMHYLGFLRNLLTGNLGTSHSTGQPIGSIIAQGAPYTLTLGLAAAALTYGTAIPMGVLAALNRTSIFVNGTTAAAAFLMGIPNFFLAILLIQVFGVWLRWLPVAGSDDWIHLILPAVVLAAESIAINVRVVRSSLLEELGSDYVRSLYARGLSDARVLWVHVLRNALPAILALAAIVGRTLLGYTLIVEVIFRWPGLGHELVEATLRQDFQETRVLVLLMVCVVLLLNLLADIGLRMADPRIREATALAWR